MPNDEKQQCRLDLIESLATSIQNKLVEPVEGRVEIVNREIMDLSARVASLEQKSALLSARHGRTRLLAYVSLVMASLMALGQVFLYIR
jgi:hypothetical protein